MQKFFFFCLEKYESIKNAQKSDKLVYIEGLEAKPTFLLKY